MSDFEFAEGDTVTVRVREHGTTGNIVVKFTVECCGIETFPTGRTQAKFDLPGMMNRVAYAPYEAEFEVVEGDGEGDKPLIADGGHKTTDDYVDVGFLDTDGPVADGGTTSIDQATVHDALSHEYRQHAVEFLDRNGHGHLDAIQDCIASRTGDKPEKIRRALYHAHLPKLDETGVATFDPETYQADTTAVTATVADIAAYAGSQLTRGVGDE